MSVDQTRGLVDQDTDIIDAPVPQQGSELASILQTYRDIVETQEPLYLEIAAGLVAKYRYVPVEETARSAQSIAKIKNRAVQAVYSACDTLILACEQLFYADTAGEVPEGVTGPLLGFAIKPLPGKGGTVVRFDVQLGEAFGLSSDATAREIVRKAFGGNDYALSRHAQQVGEWLSQIGGEVREELTEG